MSYIYRWAEKLDRLTSTATKDPEGFVGHPVNAFKLMKRLNTEWSELENLVLKDMSDGKSDGKTNELPPPRTQKCKSVLLPPIEMPKVVINSFPRT